MLTICFGIVGTRIQVLLQLPDVDYMALHEFVYCYSCQMLIICFGIVGEPALHGFKYCYYRCTGPARIHVLRQLPDVDYMFLHYR